MKKYILLFMCVYLVAGFTTPCFATTVSLNPLQVDNTTGCWCWACCDKSVIRQYTSNYPSLSNIVAWVDCGDEDGWAPIDRGATASETKSALTHWDVVSSLQYNALTWLGVRSQINNNHLIIPFFYHLNSGHAVEVGGWSDTWPYGDRVYIMDPNEDDCFWEDWDDFEDGSFLGSSWTWDASIFDCEED